MRGNPLVSFSAFAVVVAVVLSMGAASARAPAAAPVPGVLSAPGPAPTFAGTGLPSLDPDDAKFFGVAGSGLSTLAGVSIILYVGIPAGTATFSIGIFDGDVGGTWDSTGPSFSYRVYKDPMKNGSTAQLMDTIPSGAALDDDWYTESYATDDVAKAPSGNYFYRVVAGWTTGTPTGAFNNFKVRTSGQISIAAGQDFGFAGGPQNTGAGEDPWVGSGDPNPGDTNDANANSYDGEFTTYFYVPTTLTSIEFRDGDADRNGDTDDPNTPNTDPDGGGPAEPEGANQGAPEDGPTPYGACCNVDPSIFYTVEDPAGNVYTNTNPSGNTEWERFVIGNAASNPDVLVAYILQPGLWMLEVSGMDAHNLNVLRSTYEIYSTADVPLTVSPPPVVSPDHVRRSPDGTVQYYAHTVQNKGALDDFDLRAASDHGWETKIYADTDGDGDYDAGEPEITRTGPMAPNQTLRIITAVTVPELGSGVTDVTTVTASSTREWALQGSATDTTITNSPPEAHVSTPPTVPEGTPAVLNASGSTDPDGDPLEFRWDFEGDGTWDTAWDAGPVVTHTWGDDFIASPTVEVRDAEFTDNASAIVIVTNVAPTATITVDTVADEGAGWSYSVVFYDPGSDELRFEATFVDGSGLVSFTDCNPSCPDPDPSPDIDPAEGTTSGTHFYGDNGEFEVAITLTDDDGGVFEARYVADIRNAVPTITIADGPFAIDEAQTVAMDATATDAGSDDLTFTWDFGDGSAPVSRTYFNDGSAPDPAKSPGGTFPFAATDSAGHTYGDDGTFTVTLTVQDDDGAVVTVQRTVEVANVAPTIDSFDVYSEASFRLRVAGEKWHDVRLDVLVGDSMEWTVGVTRYPGSPDRQAAEIPLTRVSIAEGVRVIVYYTPDDDPVNGQPNGANPVWVILTLADGTELRLHHTFNVQHPETYEWEPGLVTAFLAHGVTVEATASDPGSDDLTFRFEFGDGTTVEETVFNNGVSPDPDPSTDVNPITASAAATHAYDPGDYLLVIIVLDDDGGSAMVVVALRF